MELQKQILEVRSPSGEEDAMTDFLLDYINKNKTNWKTQPVAISNDQTGDSILLIFGREPQVSLYAHIDTTGFTVGYNTGLVRIGGADGEDGDVLIGKDSKGEIECTLKIEADEHGRKTLNYDFLREIDRGTSLTFKPNYVEDGDYIESPYLDNRIGIWNALKVAETLESGVIVFSCGEETDGGSVANLARILFAKTRMIKALISDITWVTDGIKHGDGVAISMRDSCVPKRSFINKAIYYAKKNDIKFQLEVEDAGGSDGSVLQNSALPIEWCFIGAPIDKCHTAKERVHKEDMASMQAIYEVLMPLM